MQYQPPPPGDDARATHLYEHFLSGHFRFHTVFQRARLTAWYSMLRLRRKLKRLLDLTVGALALLLLLPLLLLVALAVKLESPGPVFFRQTRVGRWGRSFTCYKFRSMYSNAEQRRDALLALNEADGPVFKIKDDPRVTLCGRLIRKLSIDELPQLWNVIKGEMSLVGPRPALPHEVAQYSFDQARRLAVLPGITGLQQVSGRSNLSFTRWIELDLEYIAHQSVGKDLEILLKTIPAVITSDGAY